MHDLTLITTIAAAFTAAWLLGLLTQRLRLSPIVGYLLAGVLIGPSTPGFVADAKIAQQLAEVGIILLMFGVGLHFHVSELLAVKSIAIPGALVQSLVATVAAMGLFALLGMPMKTGAVLGMAMAVASTVVLMRVLMDADALHSPSGHVAVGWLIIEDILTVVLLVLIPVMGDAAHGATSQPTEHAPSGPIWLTLSVAMLKLGALVVITLVAGGKIVPWVLVQVARLRSRELFTLTVLVFSVAIAAGSYFVFGASMALGAFLAGIVVAQSPVSHQAAADALPLRDAFAVMFFVSVGMLFKPAMLLQEPLLVLGGLVIILLIKPLAAIGIVALLGHPVRTALIVGVGLAQIGEFSFILSDLAGQYGLMPASGHNVLVASAMISITLNPVLFRSIPAMETWLRARPRIWALLNERAERTARNTNAGAAELVAQHAAAKEKVALVVGYGPVGRTVHRLLRDAGLQTVVIDMNMETISELRREGQTAIFGDATHESILEQAGVRHASHLILTLPQSSSSLAMVTAARNLRSPARVMVRARYLRERDELEKAGATAAVFDEAEAAIGLSRLVLADTGVHREAAERKVRDLRLQLIMENVSNIRAQHVRSVMVPWTRVRRLRASATRDEVLSQISQYRFSRWPVIEDTTNAPAGYLLTKDLLAQPASADWKLLLRPLRCARPDDNIEATLARMQAEGATVYIVEDGDSPVGLITFEDILEQVVGRIEDEYPHEPETSLADALRHGAIELNLRSATRNDVIHELAHRIPPDALPPRVDADEITRLALVREAEVSTDLGIGVAIPHARCANLRSALVVFGRSVDGIDFNTKSQRPVQLIFLLVTPHEEPEMQLTLLSQLASFAGNAAARDALLNVQTPEEALKLLSGAVRPAQDA